MKYESIKKFTAGEAGMLGSIMAMSEMDMRIVMLNKGDMSPDYIPNYTPKHIHSNVRYDKKKPAVRRKATFKKGIQRETLLRNKGYNIDNLEKADKGLIRSGVGPFFEGMHMDKMYARGNKKKTKRSNITPQMAMNMLAEDEEANRILEEIEHDAILEKQRWEERFWIRKELEERKEALAKLEASIYDLELDISSQESFLDYLKGAMDSLCIKRHTLKNLIAYMEEELNF